MLSRSRCRPTTAVKVFYQHPTLATAEQLAVHTKTESRGFVGNMIRQRHSHCRILSQTVQLSTNDEAFEESVKRYVHDLSEKFATPKISLLHLTQHLSQLEARKTDNDNTKQQKRNIEDSSNCSQPLTCAQVSHPMFKQAGKGQLSAHSEKPSLSSIKQVPFFSLHNRVSGRGAYISYGRNLQTCPLPNAQSRAHTRIDRESIV